MDSLLEKIEIFSDFWKKHLYCLPENCIEKGIRFLSTCSTYFRSHLSCHQLTKVLNAFCTFEKIIKTESDFTPQKRGIKFRLFKINRTGNILGIAIVLKIKTTAECMPNGHLLRAILNILPGIVDIANINYQFHDDLSGLLFIYQEIEKKRGRGFLSCDIQQLKNLLKKELEENIAALTPSLFLIRNEEEIFRNIVQMGKELDQPKDIPQVTISFQEHTTIGFLRFCVVIVRLISSNSPKLKDLSSSLPQTVKVVSEMSSTVGKLDDTYVKEANIMTIEVEGFCVARKNGSIDLREARLYIAKALELMIGEYRDYNGGLLCAQNARLKEIQALFPEEHKIFIKLLFYSFIPSLFQNFILPDACQVCALLFFEAQKQQLTTQRYIFLKEIKPNFSVLVIKTASECLKSIIIQEMTNFSRPLHQFGYTIQIIDGEFYIGIIYQYSSDLSLFDSIESFCMDSFHLQLPKDHFLRINFQDGDPVSLNTHIGLDLRCRSLQKALFEGLTRANASGIIQLAAAKNVEILNHGKTYLFTLRKSHWSNGEELTAYQFEKSWKKAIKSPTCLRPDIFFILENARKARKGEANIEEVGVKALSKYSLKVTLEYPMSRLLEMLSHPLFFPLYEASGEPYVFNGPFILHSWTRDKSLFLTKNPFYWDVENVKLDGIEISIIRDPLMAFQKYEQGDLDWIGGPFSLLSLPIAQKMEDKLHKVDTPGVAWIYCNLNHPLFSLPEIRRALSYALDREKICKKVLLNSPPLRTLLPTGLSALDDNDLYLEEQKHLQDFEKNHAKMKKILNESDSITLLHSHISGQKELAIEVQMQWQEKFGIEIKRVEKPWNTFSHELDNRMFYFGTCYRHPFYYDPMYFLQIFNDPHNIHNAFGWHNERFNYFVTQACEFPDEKTYLKLAEMELIKQMPVIPLHMVTYHYLARDEMQGIRFSHSGDVDFKWISF